MMMKVSVLLVSGVEGQAIYINSYRICGPKWGGGKILKEWRADVRDILESVKAKRVQREAP